MTPGGRRHDAPASRAHPDAAGESGALPRLAAGAGADAQERGRAASPRVSPEAVVTAPGPERRDERKRVARARQSLETVGKHLKQIVTRLDQLADDLEAEWEVLEAVAQQLEEGSQ